MRSVRIAVIGDNCVDAYVSPKQFFTVGGNAVNVAAQLALTCYEVDYFGAVGSDVAGSWIQDTIQKVGVGVNHLIVCRGRTSVTRVGMDNNERIFLSYVRGVGDEYLDWEMSTDKLRILSDYDLIHVHGLKKDVLAQLINNVSVPITCDFGTTKYSEQNSGLAIAFFSAQGESLEMAKNLAVEAVNNVSPIVVVTCGAAGSVCSDGGKPITVEALPCVVIDTLGAGDSFIAGFLSARLENGDKKTALERGSVYAARTCGHFGGFPQPLKSSGIPI
jgi:fructoselysine 6-kinase